AAVVALCAGVLGTVPRPIYGAILFAAGLIATAVLAKAPALIHRVVPARLPRGRLMGVLLGGFAVVVAFLGVVRPLRAHYESIGAPPGVVSTRAVHVR